MFEDALDTLVRWLSDRVGEFRSALVSTLKETDWVLLSSDFTEWAGGLRAEFWVVVWSSYVIMIVVGGLILMTHETLQTRYAIREIAPRLVVGFLLAGFSYWIVQQALDVNNDIASAFRDADITHYTDGSSRSTVMWELSSQVYNDDPSISWLLGELLWTLVACICLVMLLFLSIMRNIAWFFVVALAPIGLACHGLPVTEWAAQLWWRMLGACMASSIGQAVLIWIYVGLTENRYFGKIGHIHVTTLYLVVILWMMWQVHQHSFRLARGRPLRMPGSRFLTGVATAMAAGAVTGRFRRRRRNSGDSKDQKEPSGESDAAESGGSFGWWDKPEGRTPSVTDLGSAFGHRPPVTEAPQRPSKAAPWWERTPGDAPEQQARPGEGEFDSMFEPAHPLEHSRRLGGFATDAGRRRSIEQRLSDAENAKLASERLRGRQVGAQPRTGRRVADVPPLQKGEHTAPGSPVIWQDPARVGAGVTPGPTPEQQLWDRAADASGERERRGEPPRSETPIRVELVPGPTPEQELWETAARRASRMEDKRAREAAELRRRAERRDQS